MLLNRNCNGLQQIHEPTHSLSDEKLLKLRARLKWDANLSITSENTYITSSSILYRVSKRKLLWKKSKSTENMASFQTISVNVGTAWAKIISDPAQDSKKILINQQDRTRKIRILNNTPVHMFAERPDGPRDIGSCAHFCVECQRWFAVFLHAPASAGAASLHFLCVSGYAAAARRQGNAVMRFWMWSRKQKYQPINLPNPLSVLRHKQQKA